MNKKIYDTLKYLSLVGIPAIVCFLSFLLPTWGISGDLTSKITGTLGAFAILLGTLIGIKSSQNTKSINSVLDGGRTIPTEDYSKEERGNNE